MIILQMAKNSPTVISHPMIILQMAKNSPTVISHPMIILQIGMIGLGMMIIPMMKMVIKMDQITTIMMMTRIGRIGLGGIGICTSRNALLSKHYPAPDWYQPRLKRTTFQRIVFFYLLLILIVFDLL